MKIDLADFIEFIIAQLHLGLKKAIENQIEIKHLALNKLNLPKDQYIKNFILKENLEEFLEEHSYLKEQSNSKVIEIIYNREINKLKEVLNLTVYSNLVDISFDLNAKLTEDENKNQRIFISNNHVENQVGNIKLKLNIEITI